MREINWLAFKSKLREDIVILPHFLKNPVQGMRTLPHWEWPNILVLQGIFAVICSTIANLVSRDILGLVTGLVVMPIVHYMLCGIAAGFFYYLLKFFFHRDSTFRQLYILVLFASLPLAIITTVSPLLPPLILLGSACCLMLLFVGLVENFQLPRKPLRNLLLGLFAVHCLYWGFLQVQSSNKHKSLQKRASPESLDILEHEMNE